MTKLSHWLKKRKLSKADFAPMVKRSRQTVHRWCTGAVTPDLKTIAVIERATDGEVTANDFNGSSPVAVSDVNVSASTDPSDGQGEPARRVTRAPQRERAA